MGSGVVSGHLQGTRVGTESGAGEGKSLGSLQVGAAGGGAEELPP